MTKPKNPHMSLTAIDPPCPHDRSAKCNCATTRRWRCHYCGAADRLDPLRATECTHVYPPCKTCGQTPECAPDCKGVLAALSQPGVTVIGGPVPGKPVN